MGRWSERWEGRLRGGKVDCWRERSVHVMKYLPLWSGRQSLEVRPRVVQLDQDIPYKVCEERSSCLELGMRLPVYSWKLFLGL